MAPANFFPVEGEGSLFYPGAEKIRQGIDAYHKDPAPDLKQ
jgi:hypothetical protein